MNRRDFLKASAAMAVTLSLPAALTAPAKGKGWKEFGVAIPYPKGGIQPRIGLVGLDHLEGKTVKVLAGTVMPPDIEHGAFWALKRTFERGGYREICNVHVAKPQWDDDNECWFDETTAWFR